MKEIIGTGVALITPFNEDKSIDYTALEKLINFIIEGGVDYLVVLGTTAETATLTKEEKTEVINAIVKFNNKRKPLVIGVGGNNTLEIAKEISKIDNLIFSAILSVSPYYNRPTQEGIYQHYKEIAAVSNLPIILYNVPSRTGSNIEVSTTIRLANDFKNIVAIKEASPNFGQYLLLLKEKPKDFMVISGDDDYALPITLAGGSGVISVIAQGYPTQFSSMINNALERKVNEAYANYFKITESIKLIFSEGNPAGIKSLLAIQNISKEYVRLPLIEASKELESKLKHELTNSY